MRHAFKADVRRDGQLRRRLDEIAGLQLKSFEKLVLDEIGDPELGRIRQALQTEAEQKLLELEGLRRPSEYLVNLDAVSSMQDSLVDILDEVPFRPTDAEGIAVASAIRDLVAEIRIFQPVAGATRIEIVVDPLNPQVGESSEPQVRLFEPVVLKTSFDAKALRKRERQARLAEEANKVEVAADGRHDIADAEWSLIKPIISDVDFGTGVNRIAPRQLINGMLCLVHAGGPMRAVPACYGDPDLFRRVLQRLIYSRLWDEAIAVLHDKDALCITGAKLEIFDSTDFPRRNEGVPPEQGDADDDRKVLLALAAGEPVDDPVRLRCEVVAMVLDGLPMATAARRVGMTASSAYHHWDNYKDRGIDALRRKKPASMDLRLARQQKR